ncbi:MAG: peptidoglycan-binding protein [Thermodesulfobacteriota bacterium]|nr:peptidoglycan-binding protein [Thermodesulfobacteriota bacterium]
MPEYKVKQGDCISSIATRHGLFWEKVWNHPKNAKLKEKRKDPNILYPGDVVFVPDKDKKEESGGTEQKHRFRKKGTPAKLRLRLMRPPEDQQTEEPRQTIERGRGGRDLTINNEPPPEQREDEPWANAPFVLQIDGQVVGEDQTDNDGRLEVQIPPNARVGRLIVELGTERERTIPLNLGHLNPIETVSGVKQRLFNLGIPCGESNEQETPEYEEAVREFQAKHGLEVTGRVDQQTKDAIRDAHGS